MGMEAQEILDKTAKWTERLYDMSMEEIEKFLESQGEDCNKILYIEYSYIQMRAQCLVDQADFESQDGVKSAFFDPGCLTE